MEIALGVYSTVVGINHNRVYLIAGERAAFFDSGFESKESVNAALRMWSSLGRPSIEAVVISHRHADHSGGAQQIADATGSTIFTSPIEKEPIESQEAGTQVGETVAHGETLDLGGATLEFVHTPGHTVGSLGVIHREHSMLFAGDTIRNADLFKIDAGAGDLGMHLDTLRLLQGRGLRSIAPGHGPVVTDPAAHIASELGRLTAVA